MTDKRKIVLGVKDVLPQKNNDIFLNLELSRSSDEIINEKINNNFNLREQYNLERETSIKFCIYGTLNSIISNVDDLEISIKTNHDDFLNVPRIEPNANRNIMHKIKSKPLSISSNLSKNIFKKNKSSFYFMFELDAFYNNDGETKSLILEINDVNKEVYANIEIPFLFFDVEGNKVPYGTETIDIDLNGDEQVINNDFPFFYDTHWIKNEINLQRQLNLNFKRSLFENEKNITISESDNNISFILGLEEPSSYGFEKAEVYIKTDNTIENPNKDYNFEPQKLEWNKGGTI